MDKKIITPRLPSGFSELLPSQQKQFNRIVSNISQVYEQFGYLPLETSSVELQETLLAKGGDETDKEMYMFTKGKNDLALHYDLTVPLARFVAEHESDLTFPFKRYQIQKVWRAERAQRGRYREFYQCDIDIVGENSVYADAEVIAVTIKALENAGVTDINVRISNRKLLQKLLETHNALSLITPITRSIDKLEKIGIENVEKELREITSDENLITQLLSFAQIKGPASHVKDQLPADVDFSDVLVELELLETYLHAYEINPAKHIYDLSIARGLDYYTGFVFETNILDHEDIGSIASGGRYDDLCSSFTKNNYPATGFSIGLSRLFYVLQEIQHSALSLDKQETLVVVLPLSELERIEAINTVNKLHQSNISAEVYPSEISISKLLSYADKRNATHAILIGEDEINNGELTIKNMNTGEQQQLALADIILHLTD